jgi:hypothetical protein
VWAKKSPLGISKSEGPEYFPEMKFLKMLTLIQETSHLKPVIKSAERNGLSMLTILLCDSQLVINLLEEI